MPPHPPHIRPSSFINLPRYTIPFLLSSAPSSLHSEQTIGLRGGIITHSAGIPLPIVNRRKRVLDFDLPTVGTLDPFSGHIHLWKLAYHVPFGMPGSSDINPRGKKRSRPLKWKFARPDVGEAIQRPTRATWSQIKEQSGFNAYILPSSASRMAAGARHCRPSHIRSEEAVALFNKHLDIGYMAFAGN